MYNSQSLIKKKKSLAVARYLLTEDLEQFKKGYCCCSSLYRDEECDAQQVPEVEDGVIVQVVESFFFGNLVPSFKVITASAIRGDLNSLVLEQQKRSQLEGFKSVFSKTSLKKKTKNLAPSEKTGNPRCLCFQAFLRSWCRRELAPGLGLPSIDPWAFAVSTLLSHRTFSFLGFFFSFYLNCSSQSLPAHSWCVRMGA